MRLLVKDFTTENKALEDIINHWEDYLNNYSGQLSVHWLIHALEASKFGDDELTDIPFDLIKEDIYDNCDYQDNIPYFVYNQDLFKFVFENHRLMSSFIGEVELDNLNLMNSGHIMDSLTDTHANLNKAVAKWYETIFHKVMEDISKLYQSWNDDILETYDDMGRLIAEKTHELQNKDYGHDVR